MRVVLIVVVSFMALGCGDKVSDTDDSVIPEQDNDPESPTHTTAAAVFPEVVAAAVGRAAVPNGPAPSALQPSSLGSNRVMEV